MNKDYNEIEDKMLLDDERVSCFLQGMMSAEEEAAFLEELNDNVDLRQCATDQARLIKGMKQTDEELVSAFKKADRTNIEQIILGAKIKRRSYRGAAAFADDEGGSYEPIKKSSMSSVRKFIAAASVIIIFFVGFKTYDYYDTINLGKEYADTFPVSTIIIRGEADENIESELATLFENVANDRNLNQTIARLSVLWQTAKEDTYNDYTDYAPYIGWYLAIAYLEDYEKDKAKDILKEMEEMYPAGTVMGDKVRNLILEL